MRQVYHHVFSVSISVSFSFSTRSETCRHNLRYNKMFTFKSAMSQFRLSSIWFDASLSSFKVRSSLIKDTSVLLTCLAEQHVRKQHLGNPAGG